MVLLVPYDIPEAERQSAHNPGDFELSDFGLALRGNCPKRVQRLLSGSHDEALPSRRAELLDYSNHVMHRL